MPDSAVAIAVAVQPSGDSERNPKAKPDWQGNPDLDARAREAVYAQNAVTPIQPPTRGHILERIMAMGGSRGRTVGRAPTSSQGRPQLHVRGVTDSRRARKDRQDAERGSRDFPAGQLASPRREQRDTPDVRRGPASRRAAR